MSSAGCRLANTDENAENLYMKTLMEYPVPDDLSAAATIAEAAWMYITEDLNINSRDEPVFLIGEIFGGRVQDLKYGMQAPECRWFDSMVGDASRRRYLDFHDMKEIADALGIRSVPVLYQGPYSTDIVNQLTDGMETVSGGQACIREGVVIRTTVETYCSEIGRVQLKSISDAYLLRRNGTE